MWIWSDYRLRVKVFILDLLFPNPPKEWREGNKGHVVLVQGVTDRWNSLKFVGNHLNNKGYIVHFVSNLGFNHKSVVEAAKDVKQYILTNKLNNVTLICYSKGCIEGKILLKDPVINNKVKKVFFVGCPNKGSPLAYWHPFTQELRPNSPLFRILNLERRQLNKIINMFPEWDNYIFPASSLLLEGGKNIKIPVKGHSLILRSKELIREIENCL